MRATAHRGSRITSRRSYIRDERGRFASTGSSGDAPDTDEPTRSSTATAAKTAGIAAVVIAATAAGTAVAVHNYHRDTAALVAAYRSALAAEQMDQRVERLLTKHRVNQRTNTKGRRK